MYQVRDFDDAFDAIRAMITDIEEERDDATQRAHGLADQLVEADDHVAELEQRLTELDP